MAAYRLYCMDQDGQVEASHWIKADTNEEAIEHVKREHPGARCELWLGKRLVAELAT